jgi:hypothetical protein
LVDDNPAHLFKTLGLSGAVQLAYDEPQPVALVSLIHPTLEVDDDVRLQGDPGSGSPLAPDWDAPAFDVQVPVPGWLGTAPQRWPLNPWLDLTAAEGYTSAGFRFYRLCWGLTTPLSQPLQCGQLWLGQTIRYLDPDLRWEYTPTANKRIIDQRTSFDVSTIYSRGTTHWRLEAEILQDDALEADLEAHWYDVDGRSKPWLLIPRPPGEGQVDVMTGRTNRAYLVRYATTDRPRPHIFRGLHRARLTVEEVSRGLRPGV